MRSKIQVSGSAPAVARRAGFTLLELLIAVSAFAIVLAAINTVFYGAVRLRNKAADALDASLPVQHALATIRSDLANIVPPGGALAGELQTTPTATLNSQRAGGNSIAAMAATTQPGRSSPEFSTASGSVDETSPWAEVQRVSYFLAPSTNGGVGGDLFRSVKRNLLPSLVDQPFQEPLMTGVQSIYFEYHDGTQWKQTWDSTTETLRLPRAIRVQITPAVEERGVSAKPAIELVVPLMADGGTNELTGGVQ